MLHLDASTYVGRGLHRECHRHPDDPGRCVKVDIGDDPHDSRREQRFYRQLERRGISWECVPRFFGAVDTNLGPGTSFELIQDAPGVVSRTLQHYLEDLEASERYCRQLCQGLQALRQAMLRDGILTLALRPKNVVCRRRGEESLQLYIVDSMGNTDFIPIATYSLAFARRKVARKWERFEHSLLIRYPHNPFLANILGRLPLETSLPVAATAPSALRVPLGGS
jgi:hypothetical protein